MSWNYRVMKHENKGQEWYGIHEVYYTNRKPTSLSADAMHPSGETEAELHADIQLMLEAFNKPVLDYKDTLRAIQQEAP